MKTRFMLAALLTLCMSTASYGQLIYFSDFESDNGGWTGDNDWQWGMPIGFAGGSGSVEPVGGFSGDMAWGTIIGGDHNPGLVSDLSQNFDFSGSTGTTLSFYEYIASGSNAFDQAKVFVNGTEEYFSDGDSSSAWRLVTLDLSAYDGLASVDVNFNFSATTVVERVGWYVDDVSIRGSAGIPEPTSLGLLSMAGVGLLVRRRRS